MSETLTIDELEFELRRSPRRTTVGVTVDRGGELILHAPDDCPIETIERVARDRRVWVYSKLTTKEALLDARRLKEYVAGEGFHYLGRSYRLKLVDDADIPPLRLYRGRFELREDLTGQGREVFIDWYRSRGQDWLSQRVERWTDRLGVQPSDLRVRSLGDRWGSCTPQGRVNLHWRTVLLPPSIIDYLLVHELAHLIEHHHGPAFWDHVERILPDYQARKRWLAQHGSSFDL